MEQHSCAAARTAEWRGKTVIIQCMHMSKHDMVYNRYQTGRAPGMRQGTSLTIGPAQQALYTRCCTPNADLRCQLPILGTKQTTVSTKTT